MKGLYTNRSSLRDFIYNGILTNVQKYSNIDIAVAFFTKPDIVQEMINNGCQIRMVVRLGFPTNPFALKKLINNKNVQIRFFTGDKFHSKLYIFDKKLALVGSANLTMAALKSNQEIMLSIDSEDERFPELATLFSAYWGEANVLTEEELNKYEIIYTRHENAIKHIEDIEKEVIEDIGEVTFSDRIRGDKKKSKQTSFIDSYRKTYQETIAAFNQIREVYESIGRRKVDKDKIPLRLELDSFLSFVRDTHAKNTTWIEQPLGFNETKIKLLKQHIQDWLDSKSQYFEENIVKTNYPLIKRVFATPETIEASDSNDLINAVAVLHSFNTRDRFNPGGLETLKQRFFKENQITKIKENLIYLLFGKGDIVKRMSDLIYDSSYKLKLFGPATVQELIGWINNNELPVVNGRTTKVLRYYGFDVQQLS